MVESCELPNYQDLDEEIVSLAQNPGTIALVGASPKPERPSHQVMAYLLNQGFTVIPVNPGQEEILGQKCYPSLSAIPSNISIDTVVIFRRPDAVPQIVEEAISRGVKAIWMQEGVINEEAAKQAKQAGLQVVMNFCIKKVRLISGK